MVAQDTRVQPPTLDAYSDMPLYNTKAVVHETGVPAPTLRAWERRYGVLSPRRGENDYRLYSERDIATVNWLRDRVGNGMTISQAIALMRSLEPGRRRGRRARSHGLSHHDTDLASEMHTPNDAPLERFALSELAEELLHHFVNLDEYAARHTIAQALAVYPVEDVCMHLLTPTLYAIGEGWADGKITVTIEHFASAVIRAQLETLLRSASDIEGGPLVLVGCVPDEMHELGALTVALFLRRAGLRVAFLGQNVEVESLIATVIATRPACVLMSASLPSHIEEVAEIGRRIHEIVGPRPVFLFGGRAFAAQPETAEAIEGEFLNMAATDAAREVKRRLSA